MKFRMSPNSLFAILLRSSWWISAAIAVALGAAGAALLPEPYRVAGAMSGLPFAVIAVLAARRQWHEPSATRVAQTQQAVAAMPWPAFAAVLDEAFRREGYTVQRATGAPADFDLERSGRRMLVCARRWKSARIGLQDLRALQTAREAADATGALYIGLGELSDNARPFAAEHGIEIWQAAELAHRLRGLAPPSAAPR